MTPGHIIQALRAIEFLLARFALTYILAAWFVRKIR